MGLIPGFTSTGSKRPAALFGDEAGPQRMQRAAGCVVWDEAGRAYTDYVMALGAVALGYGHPAVTAAVTRAAEDGVVGPLAPVLEEEVAARLVAILPGAERVRFLKTGAEAVAAAVRIARVATGRERVIGCGYHGWLDWCSGGAGVPEAVRGLFEEIPFNDSDAALRALQGWRGEEVAAVVLEPVVAAAPDPEWLRTVRHATEDAGVVLVFDEIKTAFRLAPGGAAARYGVTPDLVAVGKALANGLPLAALAGPAHLMDWAVKTWISSTLATEMVALAAARAVIELFTTGGVCEHLGAVGDQLLRGLRRLAERHGAVVSAVRGVPEMCFLAFRSEAISARFAAACAARGVLFKRTAYNFVSLAHYPATIDATLDILDEALGACS